MLFVPRASQNSLIEQEHKRFASCGLASPFFEILNLFFQPKQVLSSTSALEKSSSADVVNEANSPNPAGSSSACDLFAQQTQVGCAKPFAFAKAGGEGSNDLELEKLFRAEKSAGELQDLVRRQAQTVEFEARGCDDARALKERQASELSRSQPALQTKKDVETAIQKDLLDERKLIFDLFNLDGEAFEIARIDLPSELGGDKSPLKLATRAYANPVYIEVQSGSVGFEHEKTAHIVKNLKDYDQPTFLNKSFEGDGGVESATKETRVAKQADAFIFKNASDAEEKVFSKALDALIPKAESGEQLTSESGLSAQRDFNLYLLNLDKKADALTSALARSEAFLAQTASDKSAQSVLRAVELVEGIKEKIIFMVREGDERAIFKLNPPELGKLEIRLEILDKSCKAEIFVQNPIVKSLIESSAGELAKGLQNANLELLGLFVSVESNGEGGEPIGESAEFLPSGDVKDLRRAKKQTASIQRVNRLSDAGVDIVI